MWVPQPTSISMVTPLKRKNILDQTSVDTSHNSTVQPLNRPRHIQNKISRCLNFDVEEHNTQGAVELLHGITTDCRTDRRVQQMVSPHDDFEDGAIYSEGGPFEDLGYVGFE